jgi:Na+/melibiose symporter-like transporter
LSQGWAIFFSFFSFPFLFLLSLISIGWAELGLNRKVIKELITEIEENKRCIWQV